jgi:hypothetical protein
MENTILTHQPKPAPFVASLAPASHIRPLPSLSSHPKSVSILNLDYFVSPLKIEITCVYASYASRFLPHSPTTPH